MANILDGLNPAQRDAVMTTEGPVLTPYNSLLQNGFHPVIAVRHIRGCGGES